MLTQRQELLELLTERGERGVFVYELIAPKPRGKGIAQYNARIKELRDEGYHIINTEPGHFVLRGQLGTFTTINQVKAELEFLRSVWELATGKHRKDIELQGRQLKELLTSMEALV